MKKMQKLSTFTDLLPAAKIKKSKLKRHLLSRRPPKRGKVPRFRQRKDEESESLLERALEQNISFFIPEVKYVQQYHFHPERKWRFDVAWPDKQLAVEVQGFGPNHNSYEGMHNDCEKHNAAMLMGWKILYFMAPDLEESTIHETITTIRRMLGLNANSKGKAWSSETEALRRRLTEKTDL